MPYFICLKLEKGDSIGLEVQSYTLDGDPGLIRTEYGGKSIIIRNWIYVREVE